MTSVTAQQQAPQSVSPAGEADEADEAAPTAEIRDLWTKHDKTTATSRRTREEARTLRLTLGERLSRMKSMLARPGRNGNWTSYLRANAMARASADRYVAGYQRSLESAQKRLTEAIPATPEEKAAALVRSLLPKLLKVLAT
jgi:hypothetical protein